MSRENGHVPPGCKDVDHRQPQRDTMVARASSPRRAHRARSRAEGREPAESAWAERRAAQWLTAKTVPNTGMAVITDIGEKNDIHPKQKEPVGDRLALLARRIAYGEKVVASGLVFDAMEVRGSQAILHFKQVGGGLVAKDGSLKGFAIAGEDKTFVNAEAKIEGDTVVVSSDKVAKPVAVRFGWANYPVVNLWNKDGLPASPFRTDDFPITTKDRK